MTLSLTLAEEATRQADFTGQTVLLDLSGISHLDSRRLAFCLGAQQRVKDGGGRLLLCGVNESVRRVFEIVRLDQVLPIFSSQEEALRGAAAH